MHAYLFGQDRTVPIPAIILLVAVVAADFLIGIAIRSRLRDRYPGMAKKYGIGGSFAGIARLGRVMSLLWGADIHALGDGTMTKLVWSARTAQCLFLISLAMIWFLSQ
jgi:hypothetical protein